RKLSFFLPAAIGKKWPLLDFALSKNRRSILTGGLHAPSSTSCILHPLCGLGLSGHGSDYHPEFIQPSKCRQLVRDWFGFGSLEHWDVSMPRRHHPQPFSGWGGAGLGAPPR